MSSRFDRSIQLRAQEIALESATPITDVEAVEAALRERYGSDIEALYKAAARVGASALKGLKRAGWDIPEGDGQIALFDTPPVIVVSTPQGDLAVPKAQQTTDHARQWTKEGLQYHSAQTTRFKRATKDLEVIDDCDGSIPWPENRSTLADRKLKMLEEAGDE